MLRTLGGMVGCESRTSSLVAELDAGLAAIRATAARLPRRPRVYFEEWDEPQISAIRWVSELIATAGGDDVFPELATQSLGRDRIVARGQAAVGKGLVDGACRIAREFRAVGGACAREAGGARHLGRGHPAHVAHGEVGQRAALPEHLPLIGVEVIVPGPLVAEEQPGRPRRPPPAPRPPTPD